MITSHKLAQSTTRRSTSHSAFQLDEANHGAKVLHLTMESKSNTQQYHVQNLLAWKPSKPNKHLDATTTMGQLMLAPQGWLPKATLRLSDPMNTTTFSYVTWATIAIDVLPGFLNTCMLRLLGSKHIPLR